MNRPKYQAWDKSLKIMYTSVLSIHWTYGEDLQEVQVDGDNGPVYLPADRVVLRAFTGLTDRDGREVWEGDVVNTGNEIGVVYYNTGYCLGAFMVKNKDLQDLIIVMNELVVIGNIFEHPALAPGAQRKEQG